MAKTKDKPEIAVVKVDGKKRFVGIGKAAKWLGLSSLAVRTISAGKGRERGYTQETVDRVLAEYPQLAQ